MWPSVQPSSQLSGDFCNSSWCLCEVGENTSLLSKRLTVCESVWNNCTYLLECSWRFGEKVFCVCLVKLFQHWNHDANVDFHSSAVLFDSSWGFLFDREWGRSLSVWHRTDCYQCVSMNKRSFMCRCESCSRTAEQTVQNVWSDATGAYERESLWWKSHRQHFKAPMWGYKLCSHRKWCASSPPTSLKIQALLLREAWQFHLLILNVEGEQCACNARRVGWILKHARRKSPQSELEQGMCFKSLLMI